MIYMCVFSAKGRTKGPLKSYCYSFLIASFLFWPFTYYFISYFPKWLSYPHPQPILVINFLSSTLRSLECFVTELLNVNILKCLELFILPQSVSSAEFQSLVTQGTSEVQSPEPAAWVRSGRPGGPAPRLSLSVCFCFLP